MASGVDEKRSASSLTGGPDQARSRTSSGSEYHDAFDTDITEGQGRADVENDLNVTEDDLLEAKEIAASFSLDQVKDASYSLQLGQ